MKPVYDFTPFTLLDYPDHTACIIWFAGCNFRCSYCHNPKMIPNKGTMEITEILDFLKTRIGKLDAVVLSGGEATSYPDLAQFSKQAKDMGFKVKLDTNGSRPEVVQHMLDKKLVDYIALDFKAPNKKFESITGFKRQNVFLKTLKKLCSVQDITVEIRTTVHTDLLNEDDLKDMIQTLSSYHYQGTYYIQNFRDNETLGNLLPQKRILDIHQISPLKNFKIAFRNF